MYFSYRSSALKGLIGSLNEFRSAILCSKRNCGIVNNSATNHQRSKSIQEAEGALEAMTSSTGSLDESKESRGIIYASTESDQRT